MVELRSLSDRPRLVHESIIAEDFCRSGREGRWAADDREAVDEPLRTPVDKLLREALKKEGKAGLGLLVYHNKEWLCLVKAQRKVLVLHRLRFSNEIRNEQGLVIPETDVRTEELKMASLLIAQLTKPFKPDDWKDTYSEKLLKVIEAKAKGKSTRKPLKIVHSATTSDLMETLKASLRAKPTTKKAS